MSRTGEDEEVCDVTRAACCVVGGGPAGVMLALLLARRGVEVILLESHKDFDRDFRGDTVHPSTLEILDQLGLAERVLRLPHGKLRRFQIVTEEGSITLGDLGRLRTGFPFVALLPQELLLDFLAAEARRYPSFRLVLGATVQRLIEEDGVVRGVRYRTADGWHEVRTGLTVAADGRFSKVRSLLGLEPSRRRRRWTCSGSACRAGTRTRATLGRSTSRAAISPCCWSARSSGRSATPSSRAAFSR
jgi:2-polyprenyl-6-methoxyphenol hydroxylase-like FAD-dependent oxidoreductase